MCTDVTLIFLINFEGKVCVFFSEKRKFAKFKVFSAIKFGISIPLF